MSAEAYPGKVVLVHGSWLQGSCFDLTRSVLDSLDIESEAPDLPIDEPEVRYPELAQILINRYRNESNLTFVGHSSGSNVVAWVANELPVEGIIHLAPSFHPQTLAALGRPAIEDLIMPSKYSQAHDKAVIEHEQSDLTDYNRDKAPDTLFNECPPEILETALSQLRSSWRSEDQPVLPRWPLVPTGIIGARHDQAVRPEWLQYIAKEWLGIKVEWLEQSDHAPFYSQPRGLAELIQGFMRSSRSLRPVRGHGGEVLYWTPQLDQATIRQHYEELDDPSGVRFKSYDHAEPYVDIYEEQVTVLRKLGKLADANHVVLDTMSSKAEMHGRLVGQGFVGKYIALDLDRKLLEAAKGNITDPNTMFIEGNAMELPIGDKMVNVVLANMGWYHFTAAERRAAARAIKRVLRWDGLFALGLSGEFNKLMQRRGEVRNGRRTGTAPPPPFNNDFPTERAEDELRELFPGWNIYQFDQESDYVADSDEKIDIRLNAMRTVRKLHRPIPPIAAHEAAIEQEEERLQQAKQRGDPEVDMIRRSFFVVSRMPLPLAKRTLLTGTDRPVEQ